jgi:excisionase family DNA binding protein
MNTLTENRLDASLLSKVERGRLPMLRDLIRRDRHPKLKSKDGTEILLPQALNDFLVRVLDGMMQGKAITLMPEDETFTTQAAANYLGMSRQFLVKILEEGAIPFHNVGTHRRIIFKDLRDYAMKRDASRRKALDSLFDEVQKAGFYDTSYTGE